MGRGLERSAGVLLHPTSLPSGKLDGDAYQFIDWLEAAGLSFWQVLPLGPPDLVRSPYASASAFAGWCGLLAEPTTRVTRAERDEFYERNRYWVDGWLGYAGEDALDEQVRFDREWQQLRSYAAARGVRLIGDLPIYVGADGAEQRAHPEFFNNALRSGTEVNRRHPDGQYWGHPTYNWEAIAADGYRWWIERFRRMLDLYDLLRIDHFRGFANFWAIPEGEDPGAGFWLPGPGKPLFDAVEAELGPLPLFVEEPGDLERDVVELRDALEAPGIGVLVRGFDDRLHSQHRPENLRVDQVVYTATHDNDTVVGWYRAQTVEQRAKLPLDEHAPHWSMIEIALASVCSLAVIQAQDLLGLGSEARMNVPGTTGGRNWLWKLERGALDRSLADEIRELTQMCGRAAASVPAA